MARLLCSWTSSRIALLPRRRAARSAAAGRSAARRRAGRYAGRPRWNKAARTSSAADRARAHSPRACRRASATISVAPVASEKVAKTAPRKDIGGEYGLLDGQQCIEVSSSGRGGAWQPAGATVSSRRAPWPCSIRAIMVSSRSNRSASPGGLSQRSRLMRGNRIARPDLCRVERCNPSKATSSTRP